MLQVRPTRRPRPTLHRPAIFVTIAGMRKPTTSFIATLAASAFFSGIAVAATDADREAAQILDTAGVKGGFVVHVGCGDGELTAALRATAAFQVHGIDRDPANVALARRTIRSRTTYGEVAADHFAGDRLPYADNMVNLLVADAAAVEGLADDEISRVLVPGGVRVIKTGDTWRDPTVKVVKPRPATIDEWTHFLHDASGNPVAHDDEVGPPRHLQWIGTPRWSRHHDRMASTSAMVSAGGRMFYIVDEGSRVSIQLPPKWKVVARDAFNGTVLWKRDIDKWQHHLWPLKSGPTQLARRLVATSDLVFVTLGIDAPLTALDAATGETVRVYEDSGAAEEVLHSDGVVFVLVNKGELETAKYAPRLNVGDQRRVGQDFKWNERPRRVMAFDVESGERLWSVESKVAPLTMAADLERVVFHDGERVVCLGRTSGNELWKSEPVKSRAVFGLNFGPRLAIYREVVLFAGGDRTMKGLEIATGKTLWTAPHAKSAYQSPEDLLVSAGLVWSAPTTSTRDSGVFTGRDPFTGEVKSEFAPDVETYWFHHRCYIAKATDKFILPSRTGIEFVDHENESWEIHHWVRGGCHYGVMPCNGLVYAPPHNCACYPEAKLYGINALAPAKAGRKPGVEVATAGRLQKGPALDRKSVV